MVTKTFLLACRQIDEISWFDKIALISVLYAFFVRLSLSLVVICSEEKLRVILVINANNLQNKIL